MWNRRKKRNVMLIANDVTSNSFSLAEENGTINSPGGLVKVSELFWLQSEQNFTQVAQVKWQGPQHILRLSEVSHRHPKSNWPPPHNLTRGCVPHNCYISEFGFSREKKHTQNCLFLLTKAFKPPVSHWIGRFGVSVPALHSHGSAEKRLEEVE